MTFPKHVTVICASKYFDYDEMITLHNKGIKHFGENRTDVLLKKIDHLKTYPIHWHFIGHLQRNKASQVLAHIDYLHTLDSLKLAEIIQNERQTPLKCFIQVNTTYEPQKYGISLESLHSFYHALQKYDKIQIVGLMTMGKLDDKPATLHAFKLLKEASQTLHLPYLSMGMSDDYKDAIDMGATHIRLGRYFKSWLEG